MPNWCHNCITLTGDESELDKVSAWVESCVHPEMDDVLVFDFIPQQPAFRYFVEREPGKLFLFFTSRYNPHFPAVEFVGETWPKLAGKYSAMEIGLDINIEGEFKDGDWIYLTDEDTLFYGWITTKKENLLTGEVTYVMPQELQDELLPQVAAENRPEGELHPLVKEYWDTQDECRVRNKRRRDENE